jgi:amino acid adenylation domain-containing protein
MYFGTELMKADRLENSYPLSPMQQGMLVSSIHDRDSGVYCQQLVCAAYQDIELPHLVTAWRQVIQRHAVLRTGFRWDGLETPLQEVHGSLEPRFVSDDWSQLTATEQEQRLDHFLDTDRRQGFELTDAPLVRFALFKLGESNYRMIWTFHHALLDGRSHFLVFEELFDSYEALCTGRPLELNPPRPYSEYIDWLRKQDQAPAEVFWRASLRGFTTPTSLRVEKTVSLGHLERQSHDSAEILISEEVTAELRLCAKQAEVSLNNLVQASWALLLSRYSGEAEVLFGATRACRHWTVDGADRMVGLFINTLPFRVRVQRDQQLRDWLKEVRTQHFAQREFEHTPLIKIKEWSDVPPGTPLFNSVLVFEDYQMNKRLRALGGNWDKRDVKLLEQTDYPLTVAAYAELDLLLKIEYDRHRFDQATIERLLGHLGTILEGLAKNLDRPVGEVPFLTPAERHQLLVDWNRRPPRQNHKTISELFERQVERTPENVALVSENEQLTYRELNERANQLAHYLKKRGVGPEVLVALCLEPSLEKIICLLGTLKAGGAYVPLDPANPVETRAFKLADTDAKFLLIQESTRNQLPSHNAEVIVVDRDWETIARESGSDGKANLETRCRPENLAYVIYTSGSTGQPKGVMITHENVCRLFEAAKSSIDFNENDVWTLFHSYAFDFSVWEVGGALLYGGRLVIVPFQVRRSPEDFYRLLCEQKVTILNQTPLAFRQLMKAETIVGQKEKLALRLVILGGEALDLSSLKDWWERHGDKQPGLVNMYGITETTVHVTYRPLSQADLKEDARSVIGGPLDDLQVYILDEYRDLAPIGVPGELYVGGAGLSRGYLHRPELTADRFLPNPFSQEVGARLYRTGDVGRYFADGDVEYLGRCDRQVKVRGFRIELGEIEAVLLHHEDVGECVVIARENQEHGNKLIAYLVAARRNPGGLRAFLRRKLPEYMVPSEIVYLKQLPLTMNGKIDHRALSRSTSANTYLRRRFAAPRTATEELLAGIWHSVLKRDTIGSDDNFFDLGGHSLAAARVIARVVESFQLDLPLKALLDAPTVAEMAQVLMENEAKQVTEKDLERILDEIEAISEDEAQRRVAKEMVPKGI